ncbi:phage antirepressor KilAC domain-containing protein [Domibacillus sp. PGB-M46]|uniref:phage antirepressor KilAC domain-containing protein n=1 Tax=Domibacillus sp. PGB-M46 TaxID=2910255 RepID=UPI001F578350|nr:phage antirepressor KilAC domain-containing protein [Domibacillus sp. PGB-M46]MCI2254216.1 phage antirepressor KilAC domain-containing protein [Domibacillus sp. PGB-M46]
MFVQTYLAHKDRQKKLIFQATLETVRKQDEQIEVMQTKAEYFNALVDRHLLTNFRDTAKELKTSEQKLISWLLEKHCLYQDSKGKLKLYARHVSVLFEIKE